MKIILGQTADATQIFDDMGRNITADLKPHHIQIDVIKNEPTRVYMILECEEVEMMAVLPEEVRAQVAERAARDDLDGALAIAKAKMSPAQFEIFAASIKILKGEHDD